MNEDILLLEIRDKLYDIVDKLELGVPARKLEPDKQIIKKSLLSKWIKSQREKKIAYGKISERLNDEEVPTLSGRGKWDARTVSYIESGR